MLLSSSSPLKCTRGDMGKLMKTLVFRKPVSQQRTRGRKIETRDMSVKAFSQN